MLLKQYLVATLMASASVVLALPHADVVDLTVRGDDDYGTEYKRSPVETFVCKRDKYATSTAQGHHSSLDQNTYH